MPETQNRFSKEQKIGLILLSSFVVLAVTLGLIEMRNTLYSPFALNNSIPAMIGKNMDTPDALRYRDTDNDGLNDFDELYVYTTSPYLADSDSDGLTDKQELEGGKNPNCAEGKDCLISVAENSSATLMSTGTVDMSDTSQIFSDYDVTSTLEAMLVAPDQMRTLLLDAGLAQSVIDQISDEDLTRMAIEIMSSSTILDDMESATTSPDVTSTVNFINQIMNVSQ